MYMWNMIALPLKSHTTSGINFGGLQTKLIKLKKLYKIWCPFWNINYLCTYKHFSFLKSVNLVDLYETHCYWVCLFTLPWYVRKSAGNGGRYKWTIEKIVFCPRVYTFFVLRKYRFKAMEIPFPMMYNKSPIIKLRCRNQLPNLQTDMPMTRFFSQWEWDL